MYLVTLYAQWSGHLNTFAEVKARILPVWGKLQLLCCCSLWAILVSLCSGETLVAFCLLLSFWSLLFYTFVFLSCHLSFLVFPSLWWFHFSEPARLHCHLFLATAARTRFLNLLSPGLFVWSSGLWWFLLGNALSDVSRNSILDSISNSSYWAVKLLLSERSWNLALQPLQLPGPEH